MRTLAVLLAVLAACEGDRSAAAPVDAGADAAPSAPSSPGVGRAKAGPPPAMAPSPGETLEAQRACSALLTYECEKEIGCWEEFKGGRVEAGARRQFLEECWASWGADPCGEVLALGPGYHACDEALRRAACYAFLVLTPDGSAIADVAFPPECTEGEPVFLRPMASKSVERHFWTRIDMGVRP